MLDVLSLFSGIGAFEKALDNLHVDFNLIAFCEKDPHASKSYCAIHGVDESKNLGDITKVDETKLPKDLAILTYGFPCQDISLAGKQKGLFNEDGTQTRSGLFFDALRIIEATKPKIAIAENVKNLTSKKFNAQFQVVLASLEAAGYNNYWTVLNAKDYGVPQNRERVFIVSIREDIDHGLFEFPKPFPLEKRLKDVLEEDATLPILHNLYGGFGEKKPREFWNYSPTIRTAAGGGHIPSVQTIFGNLRLITPMECFRLMGFDDEAFHRAEATNSNTQLYNQAGNSIVVDVLEELFCMMLDESGNLYV